MCGWHLGDLWAVRILNKRLGNKATKQPLLTSDTASTPRANLEQPHPFNRRSIISKRNNDEKFLLSLWPVWLSWAWVWHESVTLIDFVRFSNAEINAKLRTNEWNKKLNSKWLSNYKIFNTVQKRNSAVYFLSFKLNYTSFWTWDWSKWAFDLFMLYVGLLVGVWEWVWQLFGHFYYFHWMSWLWNQCSEKNFLNKKCFFSATDGHSDAVSLVFNDWKS